LFTPSHGGVDFSVLRPSGSVRDVQGNAVMNAVSKLDLGLGLHVVAVCAALALVGAVVAGAF
jgi:hypothetical protein